MNRTFAVLAPKKYNNKISIEKLHLNIWYLKEKEVYVDIGGLIKPEILTEKYITEVNMINELIKEVNSSQFNFQMHNKIHTDEASLHDVTASLNKSIKTCKKLKNKAAEKDIEFSGLDEQMEKLRKLKNKVKRLLKTRRGKYLDDEEVELCIVTPFTIQEIRDLKQELSDKEILQLIFNSEISIRKDNYVSTDTDNFYLVNSYPKIEENYKIKVKIPIENKSDNHYFRIRTRLKTKNNTTGPKNNLFSKRRNYNILNEYLDFDIRVNEKRLTMDPRAENQEFCKIEKVYVFLVVPDHYKPGIDLSKGLSNVRFLESENNLWNRYINKLRNNKNKFIVYFWKVKSDHNNQELNASITILFEKLVISYSVLAVAILIIFHSDLATLMYLSGAELTNYFTATLITGILIIIILANNIIITVLHEVKRIIRCIMPDMSKRLGI
ncbi:hypothetical protein HNP93_001334 [Methanococcus maripaludis]|uniref:Uncharacterized protein n=1 Tax=Methanococcus maripaludis TaxID=39152 RepID=A0A7J9P5Y7_METMI|nr:hypothetical protein [Methanococcus maripaludis]MBA2858633.1 hypothetical protein [Methanococcus maripaludis]